jgi:hypothetical protein
MNNITKHAKNELDILFSENPDHLLINFKDEIINLCEKFGNSGQSGGSAPYTASSLSSIIKKLCLFETISPIIGSDNEWMNVYDNVYQNKRCSGLFKDGKDGNPYYIDAIIKRDQNGTCWSGRAWLSEEDYKLGDRSRMIGKRGYVKSFPFVPKTFYIDVIDVEVEKDDWESFIKDPMQLDEVKIYYNLDLSDFREEKINNVLND